MMLANIKRRPNYLPVVATVSVFHWHAQVEQDIVAFIIFQNLAQHLPTVQVGVAFEKMIETAITAYLYPLVLML
jgi:hypothetical protein